MHERKVVILYFSATSNTKCIVDECARTFSEEGFIIELITVEDLENVKNINFNDIDLFGIACPCYAFDFPRKVMEPALNLIQKQNRTIPAFIINSYCINSGLSIKNIAQILKDKNFNIIAVRGFKCPSSGFVSITSKKSTSRVKYCVLKNVMIFEKNILAKASAYGKEVIMSLNSYNMNAFQLNIKANIVSHFGMKLARWNEKRIFNNYKIDIDKCIACEVCVKQCPVKNIKIVNGKVDFINKDNCLRCMRCISNCRKNAITLGNQTKGMDRYNKEIREKLLFNRVL